MRYFAGCSNVRPICLYPDFQDEPTLEHAAGQPPLYHGWWDAGNAHRPHQLCPTVVEHTVAHLSRWAIRSELIFRHLLEVEGGKRKPIMFITTLCDWTRELHRNVLRGNHRPI